MANGTQNAVRRTPPLIGRAVSVMVLAGSLCAFGTQTAKADAVTTWNNEMLSVIRQTSALLVDGPPEVARQIAIVGTAMFDAVNAASGSPFTPYAYAGGPVSGVSAEAAALSAGYSAMNSIFSNAIWQNPTGSNPSLITNTILPEISQTYNNAVNSLYTAATGNAAATLAITNGLSLGQAAGNSVVAARANDGAIAAITNGLTAQMPPGSGTVPGVYVPPTARPEMYPTWGDTVTPFGLTSPQKQQIKSSAANTLPALNSAAYAQGLLETQCMGFNTGVPLSGAAQSACATAGFTGRTAAQVDAALFWNDPGSTIQPPGHWLQIATTIMNDRNLSLLDKARLSSLLGMGLTDAGILAWDIKYDDNLWRPITAIRNCATNTAGGTVTWNSNFVTCDTSWQSEIATPPHPDYIAGHPAFSAAAASIIAGVLGTDDVSFCSTSDPYTNGDLGAVPGITMCFNSLSAASSGPLGSTYSRILGGIHTPWAVDDAEAIGIQIANQILLNNDIPEPATVALLGLSAVLLGGLRRRATRS